MMAAASSQMVTTITAANGPGLDWAQFQAGLTAAKAAWWTGVMPDYLAKTTSANALATAYQATIDAQYRIRSNATINANLVQVGVEADAKQLRQVNEAEAERVCSVTTASLIETFVKARAEATFDYACSMADAQYDSATGDYNSYYSIRQEADQAKQQEINQAAADEVFANAGAIAHTGGRVAAATIDLASATVKAAARVAKAAADAIYGNGLPTVATPPATSASDLVSGVRTGGVRDAQQCVDGAQQLCGRCVQQSLGRLVERLLRLVLEWLGRLWLWRRLVGR